MSDQLKNALEKSGIVLKVDTFFTLTQEIPQIICDRKSIINFVQASEEIVHNHNKQRAEHVKKGGNFGLPDIQHFLPKLEEGMPIPSKECAKQTLPKVINLPKKIRHFNEYSGDYDLARKWEVYPFLAKGFKGVTKGLPKLNFIVEFGVNSDIDNHSLQRQYALLFSLMEILLKHKFQLNLKFVDLAGGVTGTSAKTGMIFNLKEYNEYLALGKLLPYFQVEFWRQVGFLSLIYTADLLLAPISSGYGTTLHLVNTTTFTKKNTDTLECIIPIMKLSEKEFWIKLKQALGTL